MFMATVDEQLHADGAVMVTASHLPWNRNGLKFFTAKGGLEKADIARILELAPQFMGAEKKGNGEVKPLILWLLTATYLPIISVVV